MNIRNVKFAVVGLGYVGLPLALLIRERGGDVIGVVKSAKRTKQINAKISPIKDELLSSKLIQYPINASVDYAGVMACKYIFVCVPTPVTEDNKPDLEPLFSASKSIANILRKGQHIIYESTVNPGVTREILVNILEPGSGLRVGDDFEVSYCPERINPGDAVWSVRNIPRVVGSFTENGLKEAIEIYTQILDEGTNIRPMNSIEEAESVKIVENCFRDVNIALANELALVLENFSVDIENVLDGANTKPFSFLRHKPGCGVGGHCIAVDPHYLIQASKLKGYMPRLLDTARTINSNMPGYTVEKVKTIAKSLSIDNSKTRVAVLGIAYKPNISDSRESPALEIVKQLRNNGFVVSTFDPHIPEESTCVSLDECVKHSLIVVIATGHDEFQDLSPQDFEKWSVGYVVDGRNCFDKKEFKKSAVQYCRIGY